MLPLHIKRGYVRGVMTLPDGSVQTFEDHVNNQILNLIVDRSAVALASAVKGDFGVVIQMAVGTGDTSPATSQVSLDNEIHREEVTVEYFDQDQDEEDTHVFNTGSEILTNKLKVSATFGPGFAGDLSELALFASPGAGVLNGGIMMARKVFSPWTKTTESSVIWHWILVF